MTKEDKIIIANEIAKTFDLYGFEMSYSEFKDIFELGAEFGYRLALINTSNALKMESVKTKKNLKFFQERLNLNI